MFGIVYNLIDVNYNLKYMVGESGNGPPISSDSNPGRPPEGSLLKPQWKIETKKDVFKPINSENPSGKEGIIADAVEHNALTSEAADQLKTDISPKPTSALRRAVDKARAKLGI